MFNIYVLKSRKNGKRYVGFTGKNVSERLREHNAGSNAYTKRNRPFELCYSEQFVKKSHAILRERFLKSGQGRKFLDEKIRAISSVG